MYSLLLHIAYQLSVSCIGNNAPEAQTHRNLFMNDDWSTQPHRSHSPKTITKVFLEKGLSLHTPATQKSNPCSCKS